MSFLELKGNHVNNKPITIGHFDVPAEMEKGAALCLIQDNSADVVFLRQKEDFLEILFRDSFSRMQSFLIQKNVRANSYLFYDRFTKKLVEDPLKKIREKTLSFLASTNAARCAVNSHVKDKMLDKAKAKNQLLSNPDYSVGSFILTLDQPQDEINQNLVCSLVIGKRGDEKQILQFPITYIDANKYTIKEEFLEAWSEIDLSKVME